MVEFSSFRKPSTTPNLVIVAEKASAARKASCFRASFSANRRSATAHARSAAAFASAASSSMSSDDPPPPPPLLRGVLAARPAGLRDWRDACTSRCRNIAAAATGISCGSALQKLAAVAVALAVAAASFCSAAERARCAHASAVLVLSLRRCAAVAATHAAA